MDDRDRRRRVAQGERRVEAEDTFPLPRIDDGTPPPKADPEPPAAPARTSILWARGAVAGVVFGALGVAFLVGFVAHVLWILVVDGWRWA
jgi:hypothetical protein